MSVAKKHDLYNRITFNSRVIGAGWDDDTGFWRVQVARDISSESDAIVEDHHAHIFINAGGILNDWKWPDIEGLHSFKGKLIHTAAWVRSDFSLGQKRRLTAIRTPKSISKERL